MYNTEQNLAFKESLSKIKISPEATLSTLGQAHSNVNKDMLLASTTKLLSLSRGESKADNRDSLEYQQINGVHDFFAERIAQDPGFLVQNMLWKVTNKGTLKNNIPTAVFDKHLSGVFNDTGLSQNIDSITPLEARDQNYKITRLGPGGISSIDSVPDSARNIQSSYLGYIDPVRSPESLKIGIDNNLAHNTKFSTNGNLYQELLNTRTGKKEWIPARLAATKNITFPDALDNKDKLVIALNGQEGLKYVRRDEIDYQVPHASQMFSTQTAAAPGYSGNKGMRLLMGAKQNLQALPLLNAESPLVANKYGDGTTFTDIKSKEAGKLEARLTGRVSKVSRTGITMEYSDGTTEVHELYDNFPYNRKTYMNQTAVVKKGDIVKKGDVIATSNFTDKAGKLATGRTFRVGYISWKGKGHEDGIVISQAAADKMTSRHMYAEKYMLEDDISIGKLKYMNNFPGVYTPAMLKNFDDTGIIKVGTILNEGDPMLLAVSEQAPSIGTMGRKITKDSSSKWEHHAQGVVTDVARTKKGYRIYVRADQKMEIGDKLAGVFGNKGTIGAILPNDQMPVDESGNPMEILLNPVGIVSRTNPIQLVSASLGKIASKYNKTYDIEPFSKDSMIDMAKAELKKHGMSDTETLTDPTNSRKIPKVFTGVDYFYKLMHTAEAKQGSRSFGGYTQDEQPSTGNRTAAKRVGGMEIQALVSHGATEVLRDMKMIKGQKNDEYWRMLKLGYSPKTPDNLFINEKFKAQIRAAGVNLHEDTDRSSIFAMTNEQANEMTKGREVKNASTYDSTNYAPITGGLFSEEATGGAEGNHFSYIKLVEPLLNPIMEQPIKAILQYTTKQFDDIVSGVTPYRGLYGGAALKQRLSEIDLKAELRSAVVDTQSKSASTRDQAIKRLRAIHSMIDNKVTPVSFMFDRLPVLPAKYRPITVTDDMTMASDVNLLYREVIHARDDLQDGIKVLPNEQLTEARKNIYDSFKSIVGLADSTNPELQSKSVGGLLKNIFGKGSPKLGQFQRRQIGASQDITGRGVATPNPDLKLTEVGLPEKMAWTIFEPFIIRDLIKGGYGAKQAVKLVTDKEDVAYKVLQKVVTERPVIINRAPSLHKYSKMALMPILTKGNSVEMAPPICSPYGLDFDGDEQIGKVFLKINAKLLAKYKENGYISAIGELISYDRLMECAMQSIDKVRLPIQVSGDEVCVMDLKDFPHGQLINKYNKKDDKVTSFYEVPKGIQVIAFDEQSNEHIWADVTCWSKHEGNKVIIVTLDNKNQIITDDDPRAVYGLDASWNMVRKRPSEASGLLVPCQKRAPEFFKGELSRVLLTNYKPKNSSAHKLVKNLKLTSDTGYFIGAIAGDGWVSHEKVKGVAIPRKQVCLAGIHDEVISKVIDTSSCFFKGDTPKWSTVESVGSYGESYRHTLSSQYLGELLIDLIGKGAINKHLPRFWHKAPRDFKIGLLSGLLDTDGSVCILNSKKTPQLSANFSSISLQLLQDTQMLLRSLDISSKISFGKITTAGNCSWTLSISSVDLYEIREELVCAKLLIKQSFKEAPIPNKLSSAYVRTDYVPYSEAIHKIVWSSIKHIDNRRLYESSVRSRKRGYIPRASALNILELIPKELLPNAWVHFTENLSVTWSPVKTIENTDQIETGYDLTVPGFETFMSAEGTTLSNTLVAHVPVSPEAVKEAKELMTPTSNLFATRDHKLHYKPTQEFIWGAHFATKAPKEGLPRTFATQEEAISAYKRGELSVDSPVRIIPNFKENPRHA